MEQQIIFLGPIDVRTENDAEFCECIGIQVHFFQNKTTKCLNFR